MNDEIPNKHVFEGIEEMTGVENRWYFHYGTTIFP